jgi:CheY-like chemotaxis protein
MLMQARVECSTMPAGGTSAGRMSRSLPAVERARTREERKHLMVVEDEAAIRELVATWLRDEGFVVTTAGNGAEAVAQLRDVRPDAIVLDLMMPIMDGWAFAEACHRLIAPARIPILVVSAAYGLPQAAERLRPYGVRACLAKPFDLDVLTATVRALVERYAEGLAAGVVTTG